MDEVLSIQSTVEFDESVSNYEVHAHQPYTATTFNNSDEIRISIQHQDLCLLPSRSSLHIYGKLARVDEAVTTNTSLVNNAICHMFEEVRYEINAVEIDKCKNVGITSLMKNWVSMNPAQSLVVENAGWIDIEETHNIVNDQGYFDISIPLSMILGFAEDYQKIVVNVKHELILTRSRSDLNAVQQTQFQGGNSPQNMFDDFKINLLKIEWLMPYVTLSSSQKIELYDFIKLDKPISMSFRTWELYEYPMLPTTSKHVWTVKTSNQLEKPRFVILAFQTNRKGRRTTNASRFDHRNISNVKLYLNSQYYPYGNLNLDIEHHQYALLYEMFAQFQKAYYDKDPEPVVNKQNFLNHVPLIVIDCSKQNESLKNAAVDVRLEFESRNNFPNATSAYCLILHDRIVEYSPISGDIKKLT